MALESSHRQQIRQLLGRKYSQCGDSLTCRITERRLGNYLTGLFSGIATEVGRPVVHQPTPTLEQVRAPIGRLGLPYPLR